MTTLFLFERFDLPAVFFVLEGDQSRFFDVLLNSSAPKGRNKKEYQALQDELYSICYNDQGEFQPVTLEMPTKDWDFFVHTGMLP